MRFPDFARTARRPPLAPALLAAAMVLAAAYLLWEGRGLTFFVDEWNFGYGARSGWAPGELLEPENGHLALVPVVITKVSLELFGAGTALPLRLVSIALHLCTALLLYLLLRRSLGEWVALAPAVLLLFLGSAADLLVGSHGMPMLIACATGLGAWLALERGSRGGDAAAASLLCLGIASNGLALLFLAGAAVLLALARAPRERYWVVALPLAVYLLWRLAYGISGDEETGFALSNLAALPAFAFDSLSAELAAVTGLFTSAGTYVQSFDPSAGTALAGALLVGFAGLWASGWRPPRAAYPALAALLVLWIATGAVASPGRQPVSGRYFYPAAILLFLIAAALIAASPWRRRAGLVLVAVCAVGLLPNLREVHYAGDFFREQSDQDRAVLAAADRLIGPLPPGRLGPSFPDLPLELSGDPAGVGVAEVSFDLNSYRDARERYGTPAFSPAELAGARPSAQQAAARLEARIAAGGP